MSALHGYIFRQYTRRPLAEAQLAGLFVYGGYAMRYEKPFKTLYRGAPATVRKSVCRAFDIEPRVMDSWLVTLNTVRNICAHHGRLWNRTLGTKPTIPRKKNDVHWHVPYEVLPDKMFVVLTILSHMLEIAAPSTAWRDGSLPCLTRAPQQTCVAWGSPPVGKHAPYGRSGCLRKAKITRVDP